MSVTIVGLSGSLRSGSYNTALLRAAAERVGETATIAVRSIAGIPVYDGDLEDSGLPAAVVSLKEEIAGASGLLLATPEYNGSLPGALKNALDWCSRPNSDVSKVFSGKPVALCGATPGRLGTVLAQTAWLPVFRTLGLHYWSGGQLQISAAHQAFDDSGAIVDAAIGERVGKFIEGFAAFCAGAREG